MVISPQRWHQLKGQRDQFAHRIMDLLQKDNVTPRNEKSPTASVPDLLVFNYKLQHPLLEVDRLKSIGAPPLVPFISGSLRPGSSLPKFKCFTYAPIWNKVSISLIDQLLPLVTIQWKEVRLDGLEGACMSDTVVTLSAGLIQEIDSSPVIGLLPPEPINIYLDPTSGLHSSQPKDTPSGSHLNLQLIKTIETLNYLQN
ncbi:hypothetical protein PPACK8108_LOCUS24977 [Phakopsora pachyrhizi]|uniref:Uncharacterized protein n=1 Tax=Phakopsora pachyrhizi TaxID=170000 RepID=A0AAV0BSV4_PHAPC|nr:hypothetical protein PPACK8108_LOCUS24977 [Phakopsora pachyrhizi]